MQATVTADDADVAWVVGKFWQGQGYATEAEIAVVSQLRAIGVRNIRARIHPGHTASQRVARNTGFRATTQVVDDEEIWMLADID